MNKAKAEISFYQLTTHPLEKVLPRILEKVYGAGLRALVVADTQEHCQVLNASLWTYSPTAFLPHGMEGAKGNDPADNPIWITIDANANKNNANVLVLTDGQTVNNLSGYDRCVDIFDGNDPSVLASAKARRDHAQQAGHPVVYWKQSLTGAWEQVQ